MHGRRLATATEVVTLATPGSDEALDRLESWSTTHGIDLTVLDIGTEVTKEHFSEAKETLGVAIGGDGAFLEAVKAFAPHGIPFLGINTGTLAFLARIDPGETTDALTEVLRGRGTVHSRQQYHVKGAGLDTTGINEVTVENIPPEKPHGSKVCKLHVFVDGEYVGEYFGTGLIVSTPTGSTGQALSNGGPIHYPSDNFTLQIVPYQTHNVSAEPIIVSQESTVHIVPETDAQVTIDGGREVTETDDEVLQITGADQPAQVVRTPYDDPFMPALAAKLGWGLRGVDDDGPETEFSDAESEEFKTTASRVAQEAARAAGEPLRELHGRVEQVEYKTDKSDIVTEADYQSNHIISTAIKNEFPNHGVLSEEDLSVDGDPEYIWLVDPLDGTGNFAHGNPSYAISIALLNEENEPIVGVVYSPETDEMFHAIRGEGAYQDNRQIAPTDRDQLDESMLLSGYDPEGEFLQQFYYETQGVRRLGCAALQLAYVASGSADAVREHDTHPWDVAAGVLLLREAGGEVTNDAGDPYRIQLETDEQTPLLASNGSLHPMLIDHMD